VSNGSAQGRGNSSATLTRGEHPEEYGSGIDPEHNDAGSSKSARGSTKRSSFGDDSGKDVDLEFKADQASLSYRSERTVREEDIEMEKLEDSGRRREKKKTMQIKVEVEELSEAMEVEQEGLSLVDRDVSACA